MSDILPRPWFRRTWPRVEAMGRVLIEQAARRRKSWWGLVWLVALLPMIHTSYLVRHYAVEVPTYDDWEMAPLIVKAHTGQLAFADVFAQQQEARTVLPKLIFILSAARGHWDVRDQMMVSVISCWLTAVGIFLLLRRSQLGLVGVAICFWLAVLAIFSPAPYELWIFASGFPSFLPGLFLVAGLGAIGSRFSTAWKFFICTALAVASSFTLSHGLLAWGLTFPVLFLMQPVPRRRIWLSCWVGAAAACTTIYFWGYQKPADLPAFAPSVSPHEYALFVLKFLGGGLAYSFKDHAGLAAGVFGALQLGLYLLALIFAVRRFRERAFFAATVPWLVLGLYSIGSAFLAALGRVGFGADYALASRYVPFSLYLTLAVIALPAIIAGEIYRSHSSKRARASIFAISLVLIVSYLVPYKSCFGTTLFFLRVYSARDRLARGAVLFSAAFDTSNAIKKAAYPEAGPVKQNAAALDRLNLLRPPLVGTNHVSDLLSEDADGSRASGWAVLNAKGRPADCVLVAYQDPQSQEWMACAISDSFEMRPEIVKRLRNIDLLWSGWTATFPRALVPAGAKLSFWAVDADEPKLYKLSGPTFSDSP